ncbi:nucleotidyltransferase domain-containing protein [Pseudomonas sp. IC_126]|uniref:nucleotidyltransferase domain-containing protein n=1 Tax=Pseudomonas sp. IC_126 TaxID=2547400 RepID=UPI002114B46E|nr:nucleotidyltransferase domain-containing protein [Pseudomonas sp. IC_126]
MNLQISGLSDKDVASIRKTLRLFPKITEAILYGSRAKGCYRPGSDIDLTLKGNELSYQDLLDIELVLDACFCPTRSTCPCITNSIIHS